MSDHFTNVSLVVPVDDPEAAVAEIERLDEALRENDELPSNPIFKNEEDLFALPGIHADSNGVLLHDCNADIEVVARIVCWLLTLPGAPDEFLFQWSADSSNPRYDGFGGGAVLCRRDGWAAVYTGSPEILTLLRQQMDSENPGT